MAAEINDPRRAGRRFRILLLSRIVEQCALGAASVLLAAYLGPQAFAPLAVIFIVNSGSVTLSDFGVGLAALRCQPEAHVGAGVRRRMRLINSVILVTGVLLGMAVRGDAGVILGAGAAIWFASAEAFVQKASAINRGRGRRAAISEFAGVAVFVAVAAGGVLAGEALLGLALAFIVKHMTEALISRHANDVFSSDGAVNDLGSLWVSQALAYAIANIDYAVVGIVLGASALSIYTIAYRVVVGGPAMIAYVASRTAVADLSASDPDTRQERYHSYVRPLFRTGAVAGVLACVAAPLLALILGSGWAGVIPTVVVLSVSLPWRMIAGQAGSLAVAVGKVRDLVRWELSRLVVFGVAYVAAALVGYGAFVVTVSVVWIIGITTLQDAAERAARLISPLRLRRWAVGASVVALLAGCALALGGQM